MTRSQRVYEQERGPKPGEEGTASLSTNLYHPHDLQAETNNSISNHGACRLPPIPRQDPLPHNCRALPSPPLLQSPITADVSPRQVTRRTSAPHPSPRTRDADAHAVAILLLGCTIPYSSNTVQSLPLLRTSACDTAHQQPSTCPASK